MGICHDILKAIIKILLVMGLFCLIMWFGSSNNPNDKWPMMIFILILVIVIFKLDTNSNRNALIRAYMREHDINEERPDINIIRQCISSVDESEIDDSEKCVICLDDYDYDNNIGKLECEHKYHQKCIERWLMEKTICPLCKYNVLSSNNTGLVLDDNPEPENNEMLVNYSDTWGRSSLPEQKIANGLSTWSSVLMREPQKAKEPIVRMENSNLDKSKNARNYNQPDVSQKSNGAAKTPITKKVVKKKDPITLDLSQALQVKIASSKADKRTVLGSKISNKSRANVSLKGGGAINKTAYQVKAAPVRNTLDSNAPTKRRGKERETPKRKRPTKMRKIILSARAARRNANLEQNPTAVGKAPERTFCDILGKRIFF